MNEHSLTRTEMLIGKEAVDKLKAAKIAIFGIGGVGGYVAEALARSGVGRLLLVDNDTVNITNLNRQIYALHSTLGQYKVDVAEKRIKDINPDCQVETKKMFYLPENADEIDLKVYDYVIDCIDTVKAKLELSRRCYKANIPIICAMGAANKMSAAGFRVVDLSKTEVDPLAKIMRKQLRKEGIQHLKVVYSEEKPIKPIAEVSNDSVGKTTETNKNSTNTANKSSRPTPASIAFVPAAEGLIIAEEVVKDIINYEKSN